MKGKIEIEVLPNNKLAVFLSSNGDDVEVIHDMLQMIYRVDGIIEAATSNDSTSVKLTPNEMERIQLFLQDYGQKIKTVTSQLTASINMLKDITFDQISMVLNKRVLAPTAIPSPSKPAKAVPPMHTKIHPVTFASKAVVATSPLGKLPTPTTCPSQTVPPFLCVATPFPIGPIPPFLRVNAPPSSTLPLPLHPPQSVQFAATPSPTRPIPPFLRINAPFSPPQIVATHVSLSPPSPSASSVSLALTAVANPNETHGLVVAKRSTPALVRQGADLAFLAAFQLRHAITRTM